MTFPTISARFPLIISQEKFPEKMLFYFTQIAHYLTFSDTVFIKDFLSAVTTRMQDHYFLLSFSNYHIADKGYRGFSLGIFTAKCTLCLSLVSSLILTLFITLLHVSN